MPKDPPLTPEFLRRKDWKPAGDVLYKDFRNFEGKLYRIGWNVKTHIVYLGYGQLPFPINGILEFAYILEDIGFKDEAYNLCFDIFE